MPAVVTVRPGPDTVRRRSMLLPPFTMFQVWSAVTTTGQSSEITPLFSVTPSAPMDSVSPETSTLLYTLSVAVRRPFTASGASSVLTAGSGHTITSSAPGTAAFS